MSDERGPGKTVFIANEDGSISSRRWNDPAWTNHFCDANPLPRHIAGLLERAYRLGMEDQQTIVKRAIGL